MAASCGCVPAGPAPPVVLTMPAGAAPPPRSTGPFEGWGTSLAWFAHATGGDAELRDAICALLFGSSLDDGSGRSGLGMNIVRYNIGGTSAEAEDLGRFRTGGAVPCCIDAGCAAFDGARDAAQTAYLLRARCGRADACFRCVVVDSRRILFVYARCWTWTSKICDGSTAGETHSQHNGPPSHRLTPTQHTTVRAGS